MPPKKKIQKKVVVVVAPQHGKGFFGDVWKGIKKGVGVLKDSKVLSTVASLVPHPGVQAAGRVAGQLGFGRGRKKALKLK